MFTKNLILGIGITAMALTLIGTFVPTSVWAATIQCNINNDPCIGTPQSDTMIGDSIDNGMFGRGGDDVMSGKDITDVMSGGDGNDVMSGGNGGDLMNGGIGSDRLNGGQGPDRISHGEVESTSADGSKDVIDCGDGNDEAWINVSVDHDVAVECETVHAG